MTIRTEMATFEMAQLLMLDRFVDGTVVVILEERAAHTLGEQRALRQHRLTLTGISADQAWRQVTEHAATCAGRWVESNADC